MRTKLLTLFSALLLSVQMFAYDFEQNGLCYHKLGGDSLSVRQHTEYYQSVVNIPATVTYNDTIYRVVTIGIDAFCGPGLTSITIPNSITTIGLRAFYRCSSLTSITIPNSVTSIEQEAFLGSGLTSIVLGSGLSKIEPLVFSECKGLTSVTIPSNITEIGSQAFLYCSNLTSIDLGTGLKTIGFGAFSNTGLSSLIIPNSVTEIGICAFDACPNLVSVKFGTGLTSTGRQSFALCPKLQSVTLTNTITEIGNFAFYNCSSLTSINITSNVNRIGIDAFYGCTALQGQTYGNGKYLGSSENPYYALIAMTDSLITSCTIHKNTQIISAAIFSPCKNLTNIVVEKGNTIYHSTGACVIKSATNSLVAGCANSIIPTDGSVTTIGTTAFSYCSALTSIMIPNTITTIEHGAFAGCSGLTSIHIPNNVTTIGTGVFSHCTNLSSVTLPTNMKVIPSELFYNCKKLVSITLPESITKIESAAFYECSALTIVDLPTNVTKIGSEAFYSCKNLSAITIPDAVTSLGSWCFGWCESLHYVTLGDGIQTIEDYTFYKCEYLWDVVLGKNVKLIRPFAFDGCKQLSDITIYATTPPVIDDSDWRCFDDFRAFVVTVPHCCLTDYQEAHGWKDFALKEVTYTFEVAVQDSKTGFVQILQEYSCDQPAIVKALPMDGYKFQTWSDGNTESMRQIVVNRDIDLVALFVPIDENDHVTNIAITPTDSTAIFTWPTVEGASSYTLIVWADDNQIERICTLTFDAAGRLSDIDFSKRKQTEKNSADFGLNFTVRGLEAGTTYTYSLSSYDSEGTQIDSKTGTFITTGDATSALENISVSGSSIQKVFENGTIYIICGDEKYTVDGRKVE